MKYLLIILLLSSCAVHPIFDKYRANKKIRKAKRLDPSRFTVDTIVIRDTVLIQSYEVDTITNIIYHDTVKVVDNSRVVLKYFYDSTTREIWHEVECKGDTVYLEREVLIEKVEGGDLVDWKTGVVLFLGVLFAFYIARTGNRRC
jgi:hypothetical protein